MKNDVCTDFRGCYFVESAGHWVQQERPERVCALLLNFLKAVGQ
jgi:pimeloyl-ACP methyl ester carboxylesterase